MRILFLAPQPFFQERGTPIAVRLALEVLAARGSDSIDLLSYHEGEDVSIPGVSLHRIWAPQWLNNIGPGISWKKILCDVIYLWTAFLMVWRARKQQYALVHAVEEAALIALLLKWIFGVPYVYDMDSSLAMQVTEKWIWVKPLQPLLDWFEKLAVKNSVTVVPVCDALAAVADRHGASETHVLSDISLLDLNQRGDYNCDVRKEGEISQDDLIILYIGNLEKYQGIDLLLESFAQVALSVEAVTLAIIGGREDHILAYQRKASMLGIKDRVKFLGPRPVATLNSYLTQADILVSPRIKGSNTPMKIYSYLHSGRIVVATELPTHTQVLDGKVALLAAPNVVAFAAALLQATSSEDLRRTTGNAAKLLVEEKYTFASFSTQLNSIYNRISARIS